ncbi:GAF domain-containing protein [Streptomyces sp. NPDC002172]
MCATWEDGAVPPYGPRPSSAASGPTRRAELDRLLEFAVRDTGVLAGAVFLPASDGQTLRLEVTTGLPAEYLTPWSRVALSSPVAVAEALRLRRLVWLSDPEEFARRYPRTAIALRHHCAAAAAPIVTGTTAWGTLLLLWPGADTARAAGPGPDRVAAACRRLGRFLREAPTPATPYVRDRHRAPCCSRRPAAGTRPRRWPRRASSNGCRRATARSTSRARSPTSAPPPRLCWAAASPS